MPPAAQNLSRSNLLGLGWRHGEQSTEEEFDGARERADAEERYAYEISGREPDEQPLPYAAEDVQDEYARVYEETLAQLRPS